MNRTRALSLAVVHALAIAAIVPVGRTIRAEPSAHVEVTTRPVGADPSAILPDDRATTWRPGLMAEGGIPVRSTICSTLRPKGEALDDTSTIQAAINACPSGQVVQLAAGTFLINNGNFLLINKSITLRGAGPDKTTLAKPMARGRFTTVSAPNLRR
jgi:hypothetical protein